MDSQKDRLASRESGEIVRESVSLNNSPSEERTPTKGSSKGRLFPVGYISDLKRGMAWSRDAIKCYSQGPWPLQLLILTFLQLCTHGLEVHGGGSASAMTKDAPWPALPKGSFLPLVELHLYCHTVAQEAGSMLPRGSLEPRAALFLPGFPTELRTPTRSERIVLFRATTEES